MGFLDDALDGVTLVPAPTGDSTTESSVAAVLGSTVLDRVRESLSHGSLGPAVPEPDGTIDDRGAR